MLHQRVVYHAAGEMNRAILDFFCSVRGGKLQTQIRQGDEAFTEGHHIHADLLAKDANGELNESGLILMHAEDQLMSAETFRIMAEEFIEVYRKITP